MATGEGSAATPRTFHVEGMDCAEEVAVLRRAVGPLVGGDDNLSFELLSGKMTVFDGDGELGEEAIVEAVARTGLTARPWREVVGGHDRALPRRDRGRARLCVASGALLVTAFLAHAALAGGVGPALRSEAVAWPVALLYLAATIAGARFVAPKALYAARTLRPDMNLLMILAILGAVGIGEWLEAATVSFLFSLALLLEQWSVGRARRAVASLVEVSPQLARVVDPQTGRTRQRPVGAVELGAVVRVRPGDKVPLDGVVVEGRSSIDQSAITGESRPVAKGEGDRVFAGTVNGNGALEVQVDKTADDTTLARIIRLVAEAQARRSPSERWVERFARYYTPLMMVLAIGVAVVPPIVVGGGWGDWLYRALVLLVIACPCALVISTPVSVVAGLTAAARAGVLIKGGDHLEAPAGWRAIALDKTGTLTRGRPGVQRVVALGGHSEEQVLATAAALEADSSHPFAVAIVAEAGRRGVGSERARAVTSLPGRGVRGEVGGRSFWLGSHRMVDESGNGDAELRRIAAGLEDAGHSLVAVGAEDHLCGLIALADRVREEAPRAVRELRELGLTELVMLTGDNAGTAAAVAEAVGLDDVRAERLPEEKVAAVAELRDRLGCVAMVGDGINDAPALATATTGVALAVAGTDAAVETADVVLMSDDLGGLPWLIRHSRRVLRIIRQNVWASIAVKVAFTVLAALGLATLWMAIAADMGASLLVIANGLRLLRGER